MLKEIVKENPVFLQTDAPLLCRLLELINDKYYSFGIHEPQGSGKTFLLKLIEGCAKKDPDFISAINNKKLLKDILGLFTNRVVIPLDFKQIHDEGNGENKENEHLFFYNLSIKLIEKIQHIVNPAQGSLNQEDRIEVPTTNRHSSQIDKLKGYKDELQSFHICTAYNTEKLITIHERIIAFVFNEIKEGEFIEYYIVEQKGDELLRVDKVEDNSPRKKAKTNPIYKANVEANNPKQKSVYKLIKRKIDKILFLIDEVNIFKSKEGYSTLLNSNQQYRNFYIKMIENAMAKVRDTRTLFHIQWIFTSVLPICKEITISVPGLKLEDFQLVVQHNGNHSFSEFTYEKFLEIAKDKGLFPNRLNMLIQLIKNSSEDIEAFLDDGLSENDRALILAYWNYLFKKEYYKTGSCVLTDDFVTEQVWVFFVLLFGEPRHVVKHSFDTMYDFLDKSSLSEVVILYKINSSRFMHFLMHDIRLNSILLKNPTRSSTEANMTEFWGHYKKCVSDPSVQSKFPIIIDEKQMKALFNTIPNADATYEETMIHNAFQRGLIFPRLIKDGEIELFQLEWTNQTYRICIEKGYQDYLKTLKPKRNFTRFEKSVFVTVMNEEFLKNVLEYIRPEIEDIRISTKEDNSFREKLFEQTLEPILIRGIKELILEKFNIDTMANMDPNLVPNANLTEEKLTEFVKIKPQKVFTKKSTFQQRFWRSKLDLVVKFTIENQPGKRLWVLYELKANQGEIHNLAFMTPHEKNYQTIDFQEGEEVVYIVANLDNTYVKPVDGSEEPTTGFQSLSYATGTTLSE